MHITAYGIHLLWIVFIMDRMDYIYIYSCGKREVDLYLQEHYFDKTYVDFFILHD